MRKRLVLGGVIYFASSTSTYLVLRTTKGPTRPCGGGGGTAAAGGGEAVATFDRLAPEYDGRIDLEETLMGVKLLRLWLVRRAAGDVLEVGAGTARNLKYYKPAQVSSLTLSDGAPAMLRTAFDKHRAAGTRLAALPVRFALADAQDLCATPAPGAAPSPSPPAAGAPARAFGPAADGPPERFPPASFDTVVSTFTLCSYDDPVAALRGMARALRPGGRLLLLEHGRASWGAVNGVLDRGAAEHRARWGCEWNRDVLGLLEAAGLQAERVSRWHFGSSYVVEARPRRGAGAAEL
jgi:methyltransferase OMS1